MPDIYKGKKSHIRLLFTKKIQENFSKIQKDLSAYFLSAQE